MSETKGNQLIQRNQICDMYEMIDWKQFKVLKNRRSIRIQFLNEISSNLSISQLNQLFRVKHIQLSKLKSNDMRNRIHIEPHKEQISYYQASYCKFKLDLFDFTSAYKKSKLYAGVQLSKDLITIFINSWLFDVFFTIIHMQRNSFMITQHILNIKHEVAYLKITQDMQHNLLGKAKELTTEYYKLILKLPIECESNKERNFIEQLLVALTKSSYFQYMAQLEPSDITFLNQPQSGSKTSQIHFIIYCSFQDIDPQKDDYLQKGEIFKDRSTKIHNVLIVLKDKYKLQTQLKFWAKKFHDFLKQCEEKEVKGKEKAEQTREMRVLKKMQDLRTQIQPQVDQILKKQ